MARLPPEPELEWSADGVPRSRAFGDVYFSRDGGLAESEAVFLTGCGLPQAWKGRSRFAICELGFGTGLNVLAVWRAWRATREAGAILHMCSIEAFPLAVRDAARALSAFSQITPLAEKLIAHWPVRAYARQRIWFPEDGFALTIVIGEAIEALTGLCGCFDAWFLDGFAPARNPAMWSRQLFQRIAGLSAPGARLASYSVASDVRRGLEEAGFRVEKQPGFGAKRERLEGFAPPPPAAPRPAMFNCPRSLCDLGGGELSSAKRETEGGVASSPFVGNCARDTSPASGGRNHPLYPSAPSHPKRVAIVGAGIAGAACAAALARRGVETIVLEAAPALGVGASGNPAGLVAPRLDRDASATSEVFLSAYVSAISAFSDLGPEIFAACGLEERAGARSADVLASLMNDPPLPPDWLARLDDGAAYYPQAGVLKPLAAIKVFLRDAALMCDAPVASLERDREGWRLLAPDGKPRFKADAVVLACGAALSRFEPASFLPLQLSRGQLEWGAVEGGSLTRAQLGAGYAAPMDQGVIFGATFDRVDGDTSAHVDPQSRARNLAMLSRLTPELAARINPAALNSRAALRVSTPDRAPVAGLLPDAPAWLAQNAGIAHGRSPPDLPAPALAGVYVIGALGARGLTLAPLLGELVASEMFGEPAPLSHRARATIHPARFLHRALKKSVTMRVRKDGV